MKKIILTTGLITSTLFLSSCSHSTRKVFDIYSDAIEVKLTNEEANITDFCNKVSVNNNISLSNCESKVEEIKNKFDENSFSYYDVKLDHKLLSRTKIDDNYKIEFQLNGKYKKTKDDSWSSFETIKGLEITLVKDGIGYLIDFTI